jgi:AraC-like DNA-binding protein
LELRYSNSNLHYKSHFHESFSIGVNKEGISTYINEDKTYILKKNMISIVNPYAMHFCNACGDELNNYYMMHLDSNWCANIQKTIDPDIKEFVYVKEHILENETIYQEYLELCEALFSEIFVSEKEEMLIDFLIRLFSFYVASKELVLKDENFEKIVSYLEENYKENITLESLSRIFDLNAFYIIRLFKSNMNTTPHSYLLNLKINKAKQLLQEGCSIVDAALESGFYDQSHFHRNFLKIVATTPKEYQLNFVQ